MEGEPASQKVALAGPLLRPTSILDGAEDAGASPRGGRRSRCAVVSGAGTSSPSFEHAVTERQAAGHSRAEVNVLSAPARYITGEESAIVQ